VSDRFSDFGVFATGLAYGVRGLEKEKEEGTDEGTGTIKFGGKRMAEIGGKIDDEERRKKRARWRDSLRCRQKKDRDMVTANNYRKFRKVWTLWILRYASRYWPQRGSHTEKRMAIFRTPAVGEVIRSFEQVIVSK